MTILYIIIFILMLSLLVMIHEAGHLIAAKIFGVYCFDYSIGFGPKLIHVKRKNGETYFSLRAIPFGGFVSMYGEVDASELPDGLEIPKSRSIEGIKKWKKAIILFSGVFMNAILALGLFATFNAIPRTQLNPYQVEVINDSYTFNIESPYICYSDNLTLDNNATLYKGGATETVKVMIDSSKLSSFSGDDLDLSNLIVFVKEGEVLPITQDCEKVEAVITYTDIEETNSYQLPIVFTFRNSSIVLSNLRFATVKSKPLSFKENIKETFIQFGDSSTLIVKSLGSIFVNKEARESVGGIIAVGYETTNTLNNFGFAYFIFLWAVISVNLAIINLLPFPGLDGWQILVTIIEGISGRKISDKVKAAVSLAGLAILFVLMGILVVKDLGTYVFLSL